jgi:hypothetical protein
VTALAHQFAGLIGPFHGSFSADNLPAKLTICLINEVSPVMLAGPKWAIFRPKMSRPRSDRVIADNWRGLYGSDPFSSIWPLAAFAALPERSEIAHLFEFINVCGVLRCEDSEWLVAH